MNLPLALVFISLFALSWAGGIRFANAVSRSSEDNGNLIVNGVNVYNFTTHGQFFPNTSYYNTSSFTPNADIKIVFGGANFVLNLDANFHTMVIYDETDGNLTYTLTNDDVTDAATLVVGTFNAAIRLVNAVGAAPESLRLWAIVLDAPQNLSTNIAVGNASSYTAVSSNISEVFITNTSSLNPLASFIVDLSPEGIFTALAYIDASGKFRLVVSQDSPSPQIVWTRVVHAVNGLSADVDFTLQPGASVGQSNNVSVATSVSFFTVTPYVMTPPGSFAVNVSYSNNGTTLTSRNSNFLNLHNYSIIIYGTYPEVLIDVIEDVTSGVNNNSAQIRVIGLVQNLVNGTVQINTGLSNLTFDVEYLANGVEPPTSAPASDNSVTVALTAAGGVSTSTSTTFSNDTSYTIWVYGSTASINIAITQDFPFPSTPAGLSNLELGLIIGGAILFVILFLAIVIFAVRSRPTDGYERIDG